MKHATPRPAEGRKLPLQPTAGNHDGSVLSICYGYSTATQPRLTREDAGQRAKHDSEPKTAGYWRNGGEKCWSNEVSHDNPSPVKKGMKSLTWRTPCSRWHKLAADNVGGSDELNNEQTIANPPVAFPVI